MFWWYVGSCSGVFNKIRYEQHTFFSVSAMDRVEFWSTRQSPKSVSGYWRSVDEKNPKMGFHYHRGLRAGEPELHVVFFFALVGVFLIVFVCFI